MDAEIVEAEVVNPEPNAIAKHPITAAFAGASGAENGEAFLDTSVGHLSAKGGAVGGVLLAMLGLAGMPFSFYSMFNVLLAIIFSIWGLKSPLRKTAITGLLIALAALVVFFMTLEN